MTQQSTQAGEVRHIRAISVWNTSGDSTITWEADNDHLMRRIIERKLKEGCAFFIVNPKMLGFIPKTEKMRAATKKRAKDIGEIMKYRAISVRDEDFADLISQQLADMTKRPDIDLERTVQSHDVEEIVRSQSVIVRPMAGG
jgi:hypothetical protein